MRYKIDRQDQAKKTIPNQLKSSTMDIFNGGTGLLPGKLKFNVTFRARFFISKLMSQGPMFQLKVGMLD